MLLFLHTFCPGEKFDFLNCLQKIGCLPVQTTDFILTFCPIALNFIPPHAPNKKNSRHMSAVLFVQNSNEIVYGRINAASRVHQSHVTRGIQFAPNVKRHAPRTALKTYSSCLSLSALSCFITLESKSPKESRSSLMMSLSSLSSCSSESAPPINSSSVK